MQEQMDFTKMSLDELTPIVSMRPGKLYSKEDLRRARMAFMDALSASTSSEETTDATAPEKTDAAVRDTLSQKEVTPDTIILTKTVSSVDTVCTAPASEKVQENANGQHGATLADSAVTTWSENKLAFLIYYLYAYVTLPIVSLHALLFLIIGVVTAVCVPSMPYLFLQILCTALYTMLVSIGWHQFMHRTKFGLILNRALILCWFFRGVSMLLSAETLLLGIVIVSISLLFLVFFFGYDSAFVTKKRA